MKLVMCYQEQYARNAMNNDKGMLFMTREEMQMEQLKKMQEAIGSDPTYMTEVAMPGCAPKKVDKNELAQEK